MTSPEAIEAAFAALAATVPGVAWTADHEPEQFLKTPAVTMLYLRADVPTPDRRPVGNATVEVTWEWRVFIYVDLRNGYWKLAQNTCRDLTFQLARLPVPNVNRTLGDTCEQWELFDEGSEPDFGVSKPNFMIKEMRLRAWTWEQVG